MSLNLNWHEYLNLNTSQEWKIQDIQFQIEGHQNLSFFKSLKTSTTKIKNIKSNILDENYKIVTLFKF